MNFKRVVSLASLRVLLGLVVVLGVLGMQSGRGTLAYFTDSVSSTGNQFTAGQLKLLFNGTNPTGTITFNTSLSKLKPGDIRYGYFTVQNDDSNSDAVSAFFNGTSNGTITFTRNQVVSGQANATNDAAFDGRVNVAVKDTTATGSITDSSTCATNWAAGTNTSMTMGSGVTGATGVANRTALTNATPTTFITDAITLTAGQTKNYCAQFTWVDGTPALDNPAKQGANSYVITFNGASS